MKIAILTLQHANNYGAVLQAFALSKFLESEGHETFFINYYQDVPTVGRYLKRPFLFVGKIIGKDVISRNFLHAKGLESRGKAIENEFLTIFQEFRTDYLNIKGEAVGYAELTASCPEADAFVVGSDQVWAADFVFSSPAYLLAFVPPQSRRISYAASFGKAKLENYLKRTFRKHIANFDAISVREKSGVGLVRELSGRDATHVLDPTFLISDYSAILDYSLVPEGDYALSYRLGQAADLTHWADEVTSSVAGDFRLPLYSVSTNAKSNDPCSVHQLQPTPGQLLALIKEARLLVTNSFHGTVFAMRFGTRFVTLARDSASDRQNLRLQELLQSVDETARFCEPFLPAVEVSERAVEALDFDAIDRRLQTRVVQSVEFLRGALRE